jgi:predicted amidohydrolase
MPTSIDKIRRAAIDAHIPLIEEAGREGVQILGLQNIGPFYGSSYFVDPRGNFIAMGSKDKDELTETYGSVAGQLP